MHKLCRPSERQTLRWDDNIRMDLSRNKSVGVASGCWLVGPFSIPGSGKYFFFLLHSVQTCSGAYPDTSPVGTGGCFTGLEWPVREADLSPPSSTEIKNGGAIPPLPHTFP
jgi:hypothetical protein